jgi:nicotinic acid mononucleotide adenylyltransferase
VDSPSARAALDLWQQLDPEGPAAVVWPRRVAAGRIAMLLGAFDPFTNAHLAIIEGVRRTSAIPTAVCMTKVLLARTDDALFTMQERARILGAVASRVDCGLAFANRGTYLDVGRVLKTSGVDPVFIIGSDKLSQLEDPVFYPDRERGVAATFAELNFIVIPRAGSAVMRDDVVVADPRDLFDDTATASISATRVRDDVRRGRSVEHLVPPEVALALGGYTSAR